MPGDATRLARLDSTQLAAKSGVVIKVVTASAALVARCSYDARETVSACNNNDGTRRGEERREQVSLGTKFRDEIQVPGRRRTMDVRAAAIYYWK